MSHVIIGASGIGKFHARIFQRLGVEVHAIVGKTQSSAERAAEVIEASYGFRPNAYSSLVDVFGDNNVESVSICSPTELHLTHLEFLLNLEVDIFCEKPLFWNWDLEPDAARAILKKIYNRNKKLLVTNNSSSHYIRALSLPGHVSRFSLDFSTRGSNKFRDIAVDLLPHGFAMLCELFGERKVEGYSVSNIGEFSYSSNFRYGNCDVVFNFNQNQSVSYFAFEADGERFERLQRISHGDYGVCIRSLNTGEVFDLVDPFESSIQEFVDAAYLGKNLAKLDIDRSFFIQKCLINALL